MTPYNVNWDRWCRTSIIKHFDAGKGDTVLFVEGFARPSDLDTQPDHLELRIDGPYTRENANDQWRVYFEVNVLIFVNERPEAAYRPHELTARVTGLFTQNILVRRYGTGPDDDQGLLGCLTLVPRLNERIQTSYFGKIRPDTGIIQATVEGHYHIFLD